MLTRPVNRGPPELLLISNPRYSTFQHYTASIDFRANPESEADVQNGSWRENWTMPRPAPRRRRDTQSRRDDSPQPVPQGGELSPSGSKEQGHQKKDISRKAVPGSTPERSVSISSFVPPLLSPPPRGSSLPKGTPTALKSFLPILTPQPQRSLLRPPFPVRERESTSSGRVTINTEGGGAPTLHMRFSALDLPSPSSIVAGIKSRPISSRWLARAHKNIGAG